MGSSVFAGKIGSRTPVIFHDSTLIAMAAAKLSDLEALALVHGVGEAKLTRYGAEFLATIAGFAVEG